MRYPFVLFDAGETLVGPRGSFGAAYARVLGALGLELPVATFESALRETWQELDRTIPPGLDRYRYFGDGEEGYWLRFAHSTLTRASGRATADALAGTAVGRLREEFAEAGAWEVFPDVVPVLTALRAAGARLAVVSNWDSRLPAVLELLGLAPFFETVTVSHLEGIEKPDPELFRRTLVRLSARPEEALHIGDVPALDLDGARAAGLDAVLIDRRGRLDPTLGAISDLSCVPGVVRHGLGGGSDPRR